MARINLVVNPSFKINTSGWSAVGSGSSIARIATDYFVGSSCLEVTKGAVASAGVITSSRIAVSPSLKYTVSGYVAIDYDQEDGYLQLDITWYTATSGGSLISQDSSTLSLVSTGLGWHRLAIGLTSPANAYAATIAFVQPTAGTASTKFKLDAVLLEQNSTLGAYVDDVTQAYETQVVNKALTPYPEPRFTGMKLNADVALGKLILNSIDESGVVWVCTDIQGWWTLPEPITPNFDRGWGDGSYDVRGRYGARNLTLEGVFLPPSPGYVYDARALLSSAVNLVYGGAWLMTTEATGIVKSCFVRLSGVPEINTVNARGRTEFSIGLRAADPIKYGWDFSRTDGNKEEIIDCMSASPVVAGSAVIPNVGDYNVATYLEVTGPIVGPAYIDNTSNGQTITISGELRAETTKTINNKGLLDNLVTLSTTTAHGLVPGDVITISGLGAPYDDEQLVLSCPSTTQLTYEAVGTNASYASASGSLVYGPDVLEIDTYNRTVYLNGQYSGARAKLDVYNEWITLSTGNNTFVFSDSGTPSGSTAKLKVLYKPGWLS